MEAQTEVKTRTDIQTVTNENFHEYVNDKLGVKKDPEALVKVEEEKAVAEEAKKKGDDVGELLGDKASEKDKHSLNERFREQTKARKDAEAKAVAAEEKAAKALQEAADLRAKYEPPKQDLGPKPEIAQFKDVAEYSKALEEWTAETTKRAIHEEIQTAAINKAWDEQVAAVRAEIPDLDTRMGKGAMISQEMRDEIRQSEVGVKILLHLAEHPEDAERIGKLSIGRMINAMAKLEVEVKKETKPKTEQTKPEVVEISQAPKPITPLKGNGSVSTGILHGHDDITGMPFEEFRAKRQAGLIK